MFCPPSAFTAANSTTAVPAVQVANVFRRFFSPAALAERSCQAPEAADTASQTTRPKEGGIVRVNRTGSIQVCLGAGAAGGLPGFFSKSLSMNNINTSQGNPLSPTLKVGQCSASRLHA